MYIKGMILDWDEAKRQITLDQRGLDFADLAKFDWDGGVFFDDERRDYGEHRQSALGLLDNRLVAIAFTLRDGKYRIISLRKANSRERKVYDRFNA
jgi:uncharacterized DUF497 family protein|tara:strand:- start:1045 stop:1332 length:288 start_codon:yes stop_codon:yes gene_type:complete